MESIRSTRWLPAVTLALATSGAFALSSGRTPEGLRFESGGIDRAERAAMRHDFPRYRLWLTTAAKGSGAYLADVRVRIARASDGGLVLGHRMDGPWLLADLAPGRYDVSLTPPGMPVQRVNVTVAAGGLRQLVVYFDTGDEVEQPS